MCDPGIRGEVHDELYRAGKVTVVSESGLARALHLDDRYSNSAVLRAVGSLIDAKQVVRLRRQPEYIGDEDRPITYKLVTS